MWSSLRQCQKQKNTNLEVGHAYRLCKHKRISILLCSGLMPLTGKMFPKLKYQCYKRISFTTKIMVCPIFRIINTITNNWSWFRDFNNWSDLVRAHKTDWVVQGGGLTNPWENHQKLIFLQLWPLFQSTCSPETNENHIYFSSMSSILEINTKK